MRPSMKMLPRLSLTLLALFVTPSSHGARATENRDAESRADIRERVRQFNQDPAAFMKKPPAKSLEGDQIPVTPDLSGGTSKYELIQTQMDRLSRMRRPAPFEYFKAAPPIPFDSEDLAENLVDELRHTTLETMESAHLTSSQLEHQPWSGTYWPIARGNIAWRYADPAFPSSFDWKETFDYLKDPNHACAVDQLSPAEKYDLLVGDARQTLTHRLLNEGQGYYREYGSVESWMGICHGWAPASFMAPRPTHFVEVPARDGHTTIRFFPSDIKALTSLLWANGSFENRFIGRRCDTKHPTMDENNRITDPACYGENPGTWHLSVVNQIGVSRRSFVMDALHDTEIWNQPIHGYSYSYFNPQTQQPSDTLAGAALPLADYKDDKFKKYRSPRAKSVVGIAMDLTYIAENTPTAALTDSPEKDAVVTVHYLYDLELGANHEILGGEWYSNAHPGFLWTPVLGARALSEGDVLLEDSSTAWAGDTAVPGEWLPAIHESSKQGQPLARIIEALEVAAQLK
jgi:hypothetical protein